MPRNRTVTAGGARLVRPALRRLEVPLPHVQRPHGAGSSLGCLVLLSLTLMTISFRGPESGPLHDAQSVGATVLRPFQVAAERVARPFSDACGWFDGLLDAKSENEALRSENEQLQQRVIQSQSALQDNAELRGLLDYRDSAAYPDDFDPVAAAVIEHPSDFQQRIVIVGRLGGRHAARPTPVVTGDGLVGPRHERLRRHRPGDPPHRRRELRSPPSTRQSAGAAA